MEYMEQTGKSVKGRKKKELVSAKSNWWYWSIWSKRSKGSNGSNGSSCRLCKLSSSPSERKGHYENQNERCNPIRAMHGLPVRERL